MKSWFHEIVVYKFEFMIKIPQRILMHWYQTLKLSSIVSVDKDWKIGSMVTRRAMQVKSSPLCTADSDDLEMSQV